MLPPLMELKLSASLVKVVLPSLATLNAPPAAFKAPSLSTANFPLAAFREPSLSTSTVAAPEAPKISLLAFKVSVVTASPSIVVCWPAAPKVALPVTSKVPLTVAFSVVKPWVFSNLLFASTIKESCLKEDVPATKPLSA